MEPLIREVLKFESPSAYSYFMKCFDTHKVYQTLEVCVIGTALEMILLYISNSRTNTSPKRFLEFFSKPNVSINLEIGLQLWVSYYNTENRR